MRRSGPARGRACAPPWPTPSADEVLIAAHSMGGLIAYDVLRAAEADGTPLPRCALVTLGAPLGLADLKLKLADEHGPLRVPAALTAWTNLMDRQDIATVGDDLAALYAPNAAGVRVRDVPVINAYRRPDGAENRHKSYGYLRDPGILEGRGRVPGRCRGRAAPPVLRAGPAPPRAGRARWRRPRSC